MRLKSLIIFMVYMLIWSNSALATDDSVSLSALEKRLSELEKKLIKAELRAQTAEAKVGQLEKKLDNQIVNKKITDTPIQKKIDELDKRTTSLEKIKPDDSGYFELHGYARGGLMTSSHMTNSKGGPAFTPAGGSGGFVGRLGNEPDTYVEVYLEKKYRLDNGANTRFMTMIADDSMSYDDWASAADSGTHVAQVFAEISELPTFKGIFRDSTIWAGKRVDRNNMEIPWIDSKIIALNGTGGGIYDIKWTERDDIKTNASIIGRTFGTYNSTANNDIENTDIQNYIYSLNNYYGPYQLFLGGMKARDNNYRTNSVGTKIEKTANAGFLGMIGYHGDSFYNITKGWTKTFLQYGYGLGAEVKNIGSDKQLIKDANTMRLISYGTTDLGFGFNFAPSLMAQISRDRYLSGDKYDWITLNTRINQDINENFLLAYEATYQYMDIDPKGYSNHKAVSGNFYKLTFAPTFRPQLTSSFFDRPEIRVFGSYMNWSSNIDKFSEDDSFGKEKFKAGGQWSIGIQMETWY